MANNQETTITYNVLNATELPNHTLLIKAKLACSKAYAPYSGFKVGCAILLEDQTIVIGNNQENAAYPSGLCAERVAFFAAAAQHPEKNIQAVAIYACSDNFKIKQPVSPCGACRQVMAEYEQKQKKPITLFLAAEGTDTILKFENVSCLLPLLFNEERLKKF